LIWSLDQKKGYFIYNQLTILMYQSNCFRLAFLGATLLLCFSGQLWATAPSGHFNATKNFELLLTEPTGEAASATITINSITNVTCFGQSNGSVSISLSGGVAPYTIAWSNGQTSTTLTGVPAGTYTVVVTDAVFGVSTATATVTQPPALVSDIPPSGVLTCTNTSLTLTTTANGGTPPYQYIWNTGQIGSTLTVTAPGTYTVGVADNNNCISLATEVVVQNLTPPTVTVSSPTITCNTPSVIIQSQGTPGPVTYAWTGPGGFTSTMQNPTVSVPGAYVLTVTSTLNGCTRTATANVAANTTPPVSAIATPSVLTSGTPTITLNGAGSSAGANITYLWSTANGNIVSGGTTTNPVVNQPGTYCLVVTNTQNGCTSSACATVVQVAGPFVTLLPQAVACFGGSTGAVVAEATGAAPITYLWSNGATTTSIIGVPMGIYSVVVTDAFGQTNSATALVLEPMAALSAVVNSANETGVGANDGTAAVVASGGTAPYTYLWSNGSTASALTSLAPGTYTVVVTDNNGCTKSASTTISAYVCTLAGTLTTTNVTCFGANNGTIGINLTNAQSPIVYQWSNGVFVPQAGNLAAGNYTITISDSRNCSIILNATITQPPLLSVAVTATPQTAVGVNNGTATATVAGGTSPYAYLWSNGATTSALTNLAPGIYTVVVTDANGCTTTQFAGVNAITCNTSVTIIATNATCFGANNGILNATTSGGAAPASYLWSTGGTTAIINGLAPGTYTVTSTDANNCVATQSATVSQPTQVAVTITSITNVECTESTNGAATFTIAGGTPPYTNTINGQNLQPINLDFGLYSVLATDANGCTGTESFFVAIVDTVAPVFDCPTTITACDEAFPFSITLPTATDNCTLPVGSVVQVSGPTSGTFLTPGTYQLSFSAIDRRGNTAICTFDYVLTPTPDIGITNQTPDMDSMGVGSIDINPFGGLPPYTVTWTRNGVPFATTEDLTGLFAGSYSPTLVDANGCSVTAAPFIVENVVDTDEAPMSRSLVIAPNPTAHFLTLKWDPSSAAVEFVQVQDWSGRILQTVLPNDAMVTLQTTNWAAATYTVTIRWADGRQSIRRIVKQ
jgi:hypothetical protein